MHLFGKKSKESEERQKKLMTIKQAIESEFKTGLDPRSPHRMDELRRTYRIESMWIIDGDKTLKFGDLDYGRELDEYHKIKEKFPSTKSLRLQRGDLRCYINEIGEKILIFSTPLDLTNTDIFILLKEVNSMDVGKTQTFLDKTNKYKRKKQ